MWALAGASGLSTIVGAVTENRKLNFDHNLATEKLKYEHEEKMTHERNKFILKNTALDKTVEMHSKDVDAHKQISLEQIRSNEEKHLRELQQNHSKELMKLNLQRERMHLEDKRKNKELSMNYAIENKQLHLEYNDPYGYQVEEDLSESDEDAEEEHYRQRQNMSKKKQLEFPTKGRGRRDEEISDESEDYENHAPKRYETVQKLHRQSNESSHLRHPRRRVNDEETYDRQAHEYLDFGHGKKGQNLSDEFQTMTLGSKRGVGRQSGMLPIRSKKGSSSLPRPRDRNSIRAIRNHDDDDEQTTRRMPALTWK